MNEEERILRGYLLKKSILDMVDKVSDKKGMTKSRIVEDAIKEYCDRELRE